MFSITLYGTDEALEQLVRDLPDGITIKEDRNWRVCANSKCCKPFFGRRIDAIYCSVNCAKAVAQREYRRRQRRHDD